ncbi:MAG: hypothetical protein OXC84_02735 [Gammaproteobacteria bacterium]|nr:hypothetical protein [Gammaproteobacteria bacterium]
MSQAILDALEPGQQVIITRTDKSRIAGNVISFDNQDMVLRHGQDLVTVPIHDIVALMVREHSRAKTAAVSGSVTIGVLVAFVASFFLTILDI